MNTPSMTEIICFLKDEQCYSTAGFKLGNKYPTLPKDKVHEIIRSLYDVNSKRFGRIQADFFRGYSDGLETSFRDNNTCKFGKKFFNNETEANEYVESLKAQLFDIKNKLKEISVHHWNYNKTIDELIRGLNVEEIKKYKPYKDGWYKVEIDGKLFIGRKSGFLFYVLDESCEKRSFMWCIAEKNDPEFISGNEDDEQ